jgi:IclR family transcriptional regulator, acetate operon repressor
MRGIGFSVMKNKPRYAIDSVDHALHLAALLQQEGPLRVTDAAERLGVSRSTAHRLLSMLVYRDFAEQGDDRQYRPGTVLRPVVTSEAPVALLRRVALPHLHALTERVDESTNMMVLAGTEVRFVATVESSQILRVGDRVGRALPAHLASGGKALLATLSTPDLAALYQDTSNEVDMSRLRRELGLVRRRGFAINDQRTEAGLTAIGEAVRDPSGSACAAVSIALPRARFDHERLSGWVSALSAAVAHIEQDLARQS